MNVLAAAPRLPVRLGHVLDCGAGLLVSPRSYGTLKRLLVASGYLIEESSVAGQFWVLNPLMTALGALLRSNKAKDCSSSMHHMPARVHMAHVVCKHTIETLHGSSYGMFMPFYDARLDSMSVNGVPPKWRPARRVGHRVPGLGRSKWHINKRASSEDIQQQTK